jgi:hypothetical protein
MLLRFAEKILITETGRRQSKSLRGHIGYRRMIISTKTGMRAF